MWLCRSGRRACRSRTLWATFDSSDYLPLSQPPPCQTLTAKNPTTPSLSRTANFSRHLPLRQVQTILRAMVRNTTTPYRFVCGTLSTKHNTRFLHLCRSQRVKEARARGLARTGYTKGSLFTCSVSSLSPLP